ncbi:hypothetical protein KKP97_03030, partial [Methanothermococcus sp. SCGC AD-155-C09]|nr:hypothetical protein [Methanothermococcus sp. SCGC AD-155-C09]
LRPVYINLKLSTTEKNVNFLSQFREEPVVLLFLISLYHVLSFHCNECNILFLHFFRELPAQCILYTYGSFFF